MCVVFNIFMKRFLPPLKQSHLPRKEKKKLLFNPVAEDMVQWVKDLSRKHKNLSSNLQNPFKARYDSMSVNQYYYEMGGGHRRIPRSSQTC